MIVLSVALIGGVFDSPAAISRAEATPSFERLTVNGEQAVLALPYRPVRRIVVFFHGAGETAEGSFPNMNNRIFTALLNAGYAVVTDDAHGDSWGNPASELDYRVLISVLHHRGFRSVYVLAHSMGGLNGLEILRWVHVKAWAGIYPACNLAAIYELGRFAPAIRDAYPGQSPDVFERGRSPVVTRYESRLPMRFWASPTDTIVPKRSNTDVCAAQARAAGAKVTVTVTRGEHGDLSNFDPVGIIRLYASASQTR